jgi:hypothetical protein
VRLAGCHTHGFAWYTFFMLFMVIEHFKAGAVQQIGERFQSCGRMLPPGVAYHASWVDAAGTRCFQVMESPDAELLDAWVSRWDDLIDFEIIPVLPSSDFWAQVDLK